MVLHDAVSYVHATAWAAGADIIGTGGLDVPAFAVINLPRQLIVGHAEGAAGATTAVMLLSSAPEWTSISDVAVPSP